MDKASSAYELTYACVQCGYCLPVCPTYVTLGKEAHSPRGRIHLVKMAAEGQITIAELEEPIDLCLGCRACETVCPTNVQYGKILEYAKEVLYNDKLQRSSKRFQLFQSFVFHHALPKKNVRRVLEGALALYQKSGLQKRAQKTKLTNLLPKSFSAFETVLPQVEGPWQKNHREQAYKVEQPIFRVGLFIGCIMDSMFSRINRLSAKLLQASGCEVVIIPEQTCCGALHSHNGDRPFAKKLAQKNIEAFESYEFDYIVNNIGGCGAMLLEYDKLFADDPEWQGRAASFAKRQVDISIILSKLVLPFEREIRKTVTYQPSCHMANVQKVVKEPLQLLQSIPGISYQPLADMHMCCGSAGIYNLIHFTESMDILAKKLAEVEKIQPDIIVTTNPGCYLQMKLGVKRGNFSKDIEVLHLVELLAEACGIKP